MLIDKLGIDYKIIAMINQAIQGNVPNYLIQLDDELVDGGFNWDDTEEGFYFWNDVNNEDPPTLTDEMKRKYPDMFESGVYNITSGGDDHVKYNNSLIDYDGLTIDGFNDLLSKIDTIYNVEDTPEDDIDDNFDYIWIRYGGSWQKTILLAKLPSTIKTPYIVVNPIEVDSYVRDGDVNSLSMGIDEVSLEEPTEEFEDLIELSKEDGIRLLKENGYKVNFND